MKEAGGEFAPAAPARASLSLDGVWAFRFRHPDGREDADWRQITLPGVWQAQHEDLRLAHGTGRHRRAVAVPADWAGRRIVLCVGAANYTTEVLVDGRHAGCHEGGYLPFEVDLTDRLQPGTGAEVELRVTLPDEREQDGPAFGEIPHGKQSWYGPLGGVWQSVTLEARPATHIRALVVSTDGHSGDCHARLDIAGDSASRVRLTLEGPDGDRAAATEAAVDGGEAAVTVRVERAQRWSPERPTIYRATVSLLDGDGRVMDTQSRSTGFRTVETRDGRIHLNGEPVVLRGALDQDYYLDTLCVPPSTALLEEQLRRAKAMGFNCLRCHIKVPDPRYLEVADRLGMLLWCELPNWGRWSTTAAERGLATLFGMINRDDHHPSIVAWTIVNEDWGTDLTCDPEQRAWLHEAWRAVKARDPSRLVVDNSPCEPNFHVRTDIADYHFYRGIPDNAGEWDAFVDDLAARRAPLFSPHGDAVSSGDEPLVLSEFGNWGLPLPDGFRDAAGREPWWFETGHDWGEGALYPHGIEHRFQHYQLDGVFGSLERFVAATQRRQYESLRYEIESLRARPAIAGYVVTELTDAHWEANGVMDMARRPRAFAEALASVNADTVVVARPAGASARGGETLAVSATIAVAPAVGLPTPARLHWCLTEGGDRGVVEVPELSGTGGGATTTIPLSVPVPDCGVAFEATLALTLCGVDGNAVAASETPVTVFPSVASEVLPRVWTPDPAIEAWLGELAVPFAAAPEDADILVATRLDGDLTARVAGGARVLLMVDGCDAVDAPPGVVPVYPRFPRAAAVARRHTVWEGNWVSTFAWLRREGPYAAIPGGPMLDNRFGDLMPRHVLRGFRGDEFAGSVRAGMVVGWVHHGAALIARRDLNRGSALLCTLPAHQPQARGNPLAAALTRALLRDTAGD